jgi:hypothetical protein
MQGSALQANGVLVIDSGKERLARVWQNTVSNELADGSIMFHRHDIRNDWTRGHTEWTLVKRGTFKLLQL